MARKKLFGLWGLFIFVFSIIILACGSSADEKSKTTASTLPTDIKNLIEIKCSMCHFSDRIYKDKRHPQEWAKLVNRMRLRNTNWLSEENANNIIAYLEENNSK